MRPPTTLTFLLAGSLAATSLAAQEVIELEAAEVKAKADEPKVIVPDPQPTPKSTITKHGLDLLGGPGQVSLYDPLKLMPSVVVETPDPYGLSPTRNLNIRGKGDFHVTRLVNGVPLAGIVGGTDLFDLENTAAIDLYRGGLGAPQGLGMSNASGAIDQQLLGPRDTFGVFGKQSFGAYSFNRTFARVDSGELGASGTRLFVSASASAANKWKGAGDERRTNVTLGVGQRIGNRVRIDLDLVYNRFEGNNYRSLSYAQACNLKDYYYYDYNTTRTGSAANDLNYYDFNRVGYYDFGALASVDVTLGVEQHLVFKPYYATAGVQVWNQNNQNQGMVVEFRGHYGTGTDLVLGYWGQSMTPPPPPTDQRKLSIASNGALAFSNWSTLARIDNFIIASPYVQVTETFGRTVLAGGVRYMDLRSPKMQYYNTAGLPDVPLDQVWGYNPTADTNAAVAARNYRYYLPNLGIHHDFTRELGGNASYSRKFGRPDWGPQASNFISNEKAFAGKGVALQDLTNRVKPELSDQFDFSLQYQHDGLTLVPTVFYAKNQNRQILVIDPALGGTLSYYQGTAKTTQYGMELEVSKDIGSAWSIFGSGTLASETYDQDTPTLTGGAALPTRGKQIPNTARTMLKGGVTYHHGGFEASPVVRYVGGRYGDSAERQPVSGYTVAELSLGYSFARHWRLEAQALNLFNRRYISQISANDSNLNAGASYYPGAPRTLAMSLMARF
jgi:iron complex outermembrane receptor protein